MLRDQNEKELDQKPKHKRLKKIMHAFKIINMINYYFKILKIQLIKKKIT